MLHCCIRLSPAVILPPADGRITRRREITFSQLKNGIHRGLLLVPTTNCWLLAADCLYMVRSVAAAAAAAVLLGMAARSQAAPKHINRGFHTDNDAFFYRGWGSYV